MVLTMMEKYWHIHWIQGYYWMLLSSLRNINNWIITLENAEVGHFSKFLCQSYCITNLTNVQWNVIQNSKLDMNSMIWSLQIFQFAKPRPKLIALLRSSLKLKTASCSNHVTSWNSWGRSNQAKTLLTSTNPCSCIPSTILDWSLSMKNTWSLTLSPWLDR